MVETRDSILTVSVRQDLTEKLSTYFAMIIPIEGKEKFIDDENEEEVLSESEKLVRKKRDKEDIDDPDVHWLEPTTSFELRNTSESQIDFPLTLKAFLFQGFKHIEKSPLSDYEVNNKIFVFYLNHNQPQYEMWSLRKLLATCNTPLWHVSQYCPLWATRHEDFPGGHPSRYYSRPSTLNCRVLMGSAALTALKRVVIGKVSTPFITNA
ncbi:unnamed protein product [Lactuca saligna]|uniref:Uncharacterized protein n=1 Tax=Lactuca saligna TaxID=75948 RepID=A0AA35YZP3_LACSI|nr:unnamed protein product [Lactuca saligna]